MSFELVEAAGVGNKRGPSSSPTNSSKKTRDDIPVFVREVPDEVLDGLTNLTLASDEGSREECVGGEDIVKSRTAAREWSSVALLLIKASIEFAENGVKFREGASLNPSEFLCASPLRVDAARLANFLEFFEETDDAEKVQTAYLDNYQTFFGAFRAIWNVHPSGQTIGGTVFEHFDTLASRTRTLPVGQTLLRDDGFTNWNDSEGGFERAWNGPFSCWTTPLFDGEDFAEATKTKQATVLNIESTTHVVLVKRCVAGMVDLDAYESAQGRNKNDGTGFRTFVDDLKSLCELGDADDTSEGDVFKKSECTSVLNKVTDPGAGLGRDRNLPAILQRAFSGSVHKYDKRSSLERAVVLAPRARARCTFSEARRSSWRYGRGDEEYDEAVRRSVLAHLVHPIQIACKKTIVVETMKTHYAKLFVPELFQKIFCVPAVCDVIMEGFKKSENSAYIEPTVKRRRDLDKSVRPDVAYAYRKKNIPILRAKEIFEGFARLAHTRLAHTGGVGALRAISIFGEEFSTHGKDPLPRDSARDVFGLLVSEFDQIRRRSSIVVFTRVIIPYVVRNDNTAKRLWSTVHDNMGFPTNMSHVERAKKFLAETNDIGKLFPNAGDHESPAEFLRRRAAGWGCDVGYVYVHYNEKYWNDALLVPSNAFKLLVDVLEGEQLEIFVREHAVSVAYALLSSIYHANVPRSKVASAMRLILEKAGHDTFCFSSGVEFVSKAIRVFGGVRSRSTALNWSIDQYLQLVPADVRKRIVTDQTRDPLGVAVSRHASGTCAVLLEYGADPNVVNEMGYAPLVSVTMEPLKDEYARTDALATMSVLLKAGADPNLPDGDGQTPLFFSDDVSVTRLLLDYGARLDVKNKHDATAVDHLESVVTGTERVVEFLKAAGGKAAGGKAADGKAARETLRRRDANIRLGRFFDEDARVVDDVVFSDDGEKIDVILEHAVVTLDAVTGVFLDEKKSSSRSSGRDRNDGIIGKSADGKFYATVYDTTSPEDGKIIFELVVWSGDFREIASLTKRAPSDGRIAFEKVVFNPADSMTMAIAEHDRSSGQDVVCVYRLMDTRPLWDRLVFAGRKIDNARSPAFSPDGLRLAWVSSRGPLVLNIANTVDENYAKRMVEWAPLRSSIRGSPFEREILDAVVSLSDQDLDGSLSALGPDMLNLHTLGLFPHLSSIRKINRYDFNFPRLTNLILHLILRWEPGFSFEDNDTVTKLVSLRTFTLRSDRYVSLENLSKVYELPSLREFTAIMPDFSLSKEFPIDAPPRRVTRQTANLARPFSPRERLDRRLLRCDNGYYDYENELVWGFEGEDGVDAPALPDKEVVEKVYNDRINRPTATHAGTQILAFLRARYDVPFTDKVLMVFSENLHDEVFDSSAEDVSIFEFVVGRVVSLLHKMIDNDDPPDVRVLARTFRTVRGGYGVLGIYGASKFREWFLSDEFEEDMRAYGEWLRRHNDEAYRERAGWKKLIESGFVVEEG